MPYKARELVIIVGNSRGSDANISAKLSPSCFWQGLWAHCKFGCKFKSDTRRFSVTLLASAPGRTPDYLLSAKKLINIRYSPCCRLCCSLSLPEQVAAISASEEVKAPPAAARTAGATACNIYTLFGVSPDVPQSHLRAVMRRVLLVTHPDKVADACPRAYSAVKEAYDVLRKPETRMYYDFEHSLFTPSTSDPGVRYST